MWTGAAKTFAYAKGDKNESEADKKFLLGTRGRPSNSFCFKSDAMSDEDDCLGPVAIFGHVFGLYQWSKVSVIASCIRSMCGWLQTILHSAGLCHRPNSKPLAVALFTFFSEETDIIDAECIHFKVIGSICIASRLPYFVNMRKSLSSNCSYWLGAHPRSCDRMHTPNTATE